MKEAEVGHIRYTLIPVSEMVFALPAEQWQMRIVPDDDHDDLPVISQVYSESQLLRAVGFLRAKNANGYHIYGRPIANGHVLVDDLDQDALHRMTADGLRPNVAVRTSKGNHQAWVTISKDEIRPDIAKSAARLLAKRYGGDPGSADARHVGRLPGFTNRKGIYWTARGYPFTGLHGPVWRGVAPGAGKLLQDSIDLAASPSPPSTLGGCAPFDIDPERSALEPHEAREIYQETVGSLAEKFRWQLPTKKGKRSEVDFAVARSLIRYTGYDTDDAAAVLMYGSEKAAERGTDYVLWTVNAAAKKL